MGRYACQEPTVRRGESLFSACHGQRAELFGYPAGHRFVHGGIEVGDIVAAIPDMDAIAINLPMENAHTTNELLYIDRVPEFWALFTAVFAEK